MRAYFLYARVTGKLKAVNVLKPSAITEKAHGIGMKKVGRKEGNIVLKDQ